MKKILHSKINPQIQDDGTVSLEYFLTENTIFSEDCFVKCYGVEIVRSFVCKGLKLSEVKQIPNIFINRYEALRLLKNLAADKITPTRLSQKIEDYISGALKNEKRIPILL